MALGFTEIQRSDAPASGKVFATVAGNTIRPIDSLGNFYGSRILRPGDVFTIAGQESFEFEFHYDYQTYGIYTIEHSNRLDLVSGFDLAATEGQEIIYLRTRVYDDIPPADLYVSGYFNSGTNSSIDLTYTGSDIAAADVYKHLMGKVIKFDGHDAILPETKYVKYFSPETRIYLHDDIQDLGFSSNVVTNTLVSGYGSWDDPIIDAAKNSLYVSSLNDSYNRIMLATDSTTYAVAAIIDLFVFPGDSFTIGGLTGTVFTTENDDASYIVPDEDITNYTITTGSYLTFGEPAPGITLTVPDPIDNSNVLNVPISGNVPGAQVGEYVDVFIDDGLGGTYGWSAPLDGTGDFATSLYLKDLADATITFTVTHYTDNTLTTVIDSATFTTTQLVDPDITLSVTMPAVDGSNVAAAVITGLMTGQTTGTGVNVDVSDDFGGTISGSTTIAADGTYSVTLDLSSLQDGGMMAYVEHADQVLLTATDTNVKSTAAPAGTISVIIENAYPGDLAAYSVAGSTTDIAEGQTVSISITDTGAGEVNGTALVGADGLYSTTVDITALADGAITASVSVVDGNGDTATGTDTAQKDSLYTSSLGVVAQGAMYYTQSAVEYSVSGEGLGGASVDVLVTGALGTTVSETVVLDANGDYTGTINLSTLADGEYIFDVSATDQAGDPVAASGTAIKNTARSISVSYVGEPDPVGDILDVTGQAINLPWESPVTITITDSIGGTLSVTVNSAAQADGDAYNGFSARLDISTLEDGAITIEATAMDHDGTTEIVGTNSTTKDTSGGTGGTDPQPGTIDVSAPLVDANNVAAVVVSGTTSNVPESNSVSLTVTDSALATVTGSALVGADGTYSASLDLTALADGELTLDASVEDETLATISASSTTTKDTSGTGDTGGGDTGGTEEPAGSISVVLDDVTSANEASVAVSGDSSNIPQDAVVDISVTDENSLVITATATIQTDGSYATTMDLSSLSEGTLTVSVSVIDANIVEQTSTSTATKSTTGSEVFEANVAFHPSAFTIANRRLASIADTGDVRVRDYTHPATGMVFRIVVWYNPRTCSKHYKLMALAGGAVTNEKAASIVLPSDS